MKIAISEIQQEELVSNVDASAGRKVLGGASLQGRTSTLTAFGRSNVAIGNATVFAFTTTNAEGSVASISAAGKANGTGFSISSSYSSAVTG